jgi:hypothetical protein
MYVWTSLEILVMVVQNIILKVVGFILIVEMVKLMKERIVIIVHRMHECAVEMELEIMERLVRRVK